MTFRIAASLLAADFAKAGANRISFHPEASELADRTIDRIQENG